MAQLAPLYCELFPVCSNGMVPNIKSVIALTNAHASNALYSSKETVTKCAPDVFGHVRNVAKQWRDLVVYPEKLEVCLRKAWGMQNKNREGHLRTMSLWGQTLKALGVNRL